MMKLLKHLDLYTPAHLGKKDILIAEGKILKIEDSIDIQGVDAEVIEYKNHKALPGFIDNHVHIIGGGGENGPASSIPEIHIDDLTQAGITTVIGLLGTDGITKNMKNLISKTKALNHQGMSAYALSGSYQVPVKTLLSSIEDDLTFIEEIIGVGEIAISDHRSSLPTINELKKVLASAHVGSLLSGKAGITNIHVGSGETGLKPITEILDTTDLPARKILPTHINRSHALLEEGIAYSKYYNAPIDFTAYINKDDDLAAYHAFKQALDSGVKLENITLSSDGQGSLPVFDQDGHFITMGIASVKALFENIKKAHLQGHIPLEDALMPITKNVANLFKLKDKGELKVGKDADIVIADKDLNIQEVYVKGERQKR